MKADKQFNIEKLLATSLLMTILQLLLILGVISYTYVRGNNELFGLIYIALGVTVLNSVITSLGYFFSFHKKKDNLIERIEDLQALNSKLREQRHDYLNHLQVIYGLMELEEYEEARSYMEPVYKDIIKVSKALKTSHPAINALLQAKMQVAEEHSIDMFIEIKTNLKAIPLEAWELCKVMANIIDNGIRALDEKDEMDKRIYINIYENETNYMLHIYNNGPQIPSCYLRDIFSEGFTTKPGEGHGMGLYITKSIIEKVQGTIEAASSRERTYFSIELPKVTT